MWRATLVIVATLGLAALARADEVEATAPTRVRATPSKNGKTVVRIAAGARLRVLKKKAKWLRVQAAGGVGWVEADAVRKASPARLVADSTPGILGGAALKAPTLVPPIAPLSPAASASAPAPDTSLKRRRRAIDLDADTGDAADVVVPLPEPWLRVAAQLGLRHLRGSFDSDGSGTLARYRFVSDAGVVATGADATAKLGWFSVAADLRYAYAYATPGFRYQSGEMVEHVSFSVHDVGAGARVGVATKRAIVQARGGYVYSYFHPEHLETAARLPRESLHGPVAGGRVELPALVGGVDVQGELDMLIGGRLTQTRGMADGEPERIAAAWARLQASGSIAPAMEMQVIYQLGWTRMDFAGAGGRQPDVTSATRNEKCHLLLVGFGRDF